MKRFDRQLWTSFAVVGLGLGGCDGAPRARGEATPSVQGPRGEAGAQGPGGREGDRGRRGDDGPTGPQGPRGWDGAPGPAGPDGVTGLVGPAGEDGLPGTPGVQGPGGVVGRAGRDSAQAGPAGPQGPQGEVGARGADGATGATGPRGVPGALGPQGDPGAKGETGPAGPMGPRGPMGAIGAPGPEGPEGPTGPQGAQGPMGATGPTGDTGPAGVNCAAGDGNGDGVTDARDCVPELLALRCTDREQPQVLDGVWTCQATNVGAQRSRAGFVEEFNVSDHLARSGWTTIGLAELSNALFADHGGYVALSNQALGRAAVLYRVGPGVDLFAVDTELQALVSGDFPAAESAAVGFFDATGTPVGAVVHRDGAWVATCRQGGLVDGAEVSLALPVLAFNQAKFTFTQANQPRLVVTLDGVDVATLDCGATFTPGGFGMAVDPPEDSGALAAVSMDYATWRTFR